MSRKDELLKLADVFHSQAERSGTQPVKWALQKMGDAFVSARTGPPTSISCIRAFTISARLRSPSTC